MMRYAQPHVPLRINHFIRADLLQHFPVQLILSLDYNQRAAHIFQNKRRENACLDIFPDRHDHDIEVADSERPKRFFIGGIRRYRMSHYIRHRLGMLFVRIDREYVKPHSAERFSHT
ncbi:hypothetical protein D3C73_1172270 [compost metagenome]